MGLVLACSTVDTRTLLFLALVLPFTTFKALCSAGSQSAPFSDLRVELEVLAGLAFDAHFASCCWLVLAARARLACSFTYGGARRCGIFANFAVFTAEMHTSSGFELTHRALLAKRQACHIGVRAWSALPALRNATGGLGLADGAVLARWLASHVLMLATRTIVTTGTQYASLVLSWCACRTLKLATLNLEVSGRTRFAR